MSDELNPKKHLSPQSPKVLNRKVYYADDKIIQQGSEGSRAYYIEKGHVEVFLYEGQTRLKIADLYDGDIFGEMALINHDPRSATVIAKTTCTISIIEREEIEGKVARIEDPAMKALIHVLAKRLGEAVQGQFEQYRDLTALQDRIAGMVDRMYTNIAEDQRENFLKEVHPLLKDLQDVIDRYQNHSES